MWLLHKQVISSEIIRTIIIILIFFYPKLHVEIISITILLLSYSLRVFHSIVSWWFSIEVWVTTSLLKSAGLISIFWPISIMLLFGWLPLVLLFACSPVPDQSFSDCTESTNSTFYHGHFHLSLIGIILRWGFLIWDLIFIYCGLIFLILVVFVLFLLPLRFGQISPLAFFRWFYRDLG